MNPEETQFQADDERRRALRLSKLPTRAPAQIPGYDLKAFLGAGSYGQVWVGIDHNTGRQVAVKFYAHRGGLDWSLLSREVEKLVFLSADRHVVQLLDVGWDSDPPYYVMEYVEQGSLETHLRRRTTLPVAEAVGHFREIAVGLMHAHGKGVLHCDLKPSNILLDVDQKPRLADFGQSRLTSEQSPALGTLFYMAPEQADLRAVPDARWDVYALGAVLYCMLTGAPPHRRQESTTELDSAVDLEDRLARYRDLLRKSSKPVGHRKVPGVDRSLADIVDRCLATDPDQRYPNVPAILADLDARDARRARRPLVVFGVVGPILLLVVMAYFSIQGFMSLMDQSSDAITARALQSNRFAAEFVAKTAAASLESRYRAVEEVAAEESLRGQLKALLADETLAPTLRALADPNVKPADAAPLRTEFLQHPLRAEIELRLSTVQEKWERDADGLTFAASWFIDDRYGNQIARVPMPEERETRGTNYAYRTYFQRGAEDRDPAWRPSSEDEIIGDTTLSAVFQSQATGHWIVAVSTPLRAADGTLLGVIAMTVEMNGLAELSGGENRFAVLVDRREGNRKGLILQHPLFRNYGRPGTGERLPEAFKEPQCRVTDERLPAEVAPDVPAGEDPRRNYIDPISNPPEGAAYRGKWLAEMAPVLLRGRETGLVVIVQESYDEAIGTTFEAMERTVLRNSAAAMILFVGVVAALWGLMYWSLRRRRGAMPHDGAADDELTPAVGEATLIASQTAGEGPE